VVCVSLMESFKTKKKNKIIPKPHYVVGFHLHLGGDYNYLMVYTTGSKRITKVLIKHIDSDCFLGVNFGINNSLFIALSAL